MPSRAGKDWIGSKGRAFTYARNRASLHRMKPMTRAAVVEIDFSQTPHRGPQRERATQARAVQTPGDERAFEFEGDMAETKQHGHPLW